MICVYYQQIVQEKIPQTNRSSSHHILSLKQKGITSIVITKSMNKVPIQPYVLQITNRQITVRSDSPKLFVNLPNSILQFFL